MKSSFSKEKRGSTLSHKPRQFANLVNCKPSDPARDVFAGYSDLVALFDPDLVDEEAYIASKKRQRHAKMVKRLEAQKEKLRREQLILASAPANTTKKIAEEPSSVTKKSQPPAKRGKQFIEPPEPKPVVEKKHSSKKQSYHTPGHSGPERERKEQSDFTMSSAKKEMERVDSNSVISEAESAFEDLSPRGVAARKRKFEKGLTSGGDYTAKED